jgi:hypothetical protein
VPFPGSRLAHRDPVPEPRKAGGTHGKRAKFASEGSAEAGRPGTKTELRKAKHRAFGAEYEGGKASGGRGHISNSLCGHHMYTTDSQRRGYGDPRCIKIKRHDGNHRYGK